MADEHTTLVRKVFEEVERGRTPMELLTPTFTAHFTGLPAMDADGFDQFETAFRAAFGHDHHIDDVVAKGDRVAVRLRVMGTHTGEFIGVPASGQDVEVEGSAFFRIEGDRIAEFWGLMDQLGLMQQIGALPAPEQAG